MKWFPLALAILVGVALVGVKSASVTSQEQRNADAHTAYELGRAEGVTRALAYCAERHHLEATWPSR